MSHPIKKCLSLPFVLLAFILLVSPLQARAETDLQKALQSHIEKTLGPGWVASPHGADASFRPKTQFIYLDTLQKEFKGTKVEKGWVPFSSGLSIYPDEYVVIQREKVSLKAQTADSVTKIGVSAAMQGLLSELGLDASIKAEVENKWDFKIEVEEAEKEWVWQLDMRLAQEITQRNVERMVEILKKRYEKVPRVMVVTGALRVRGFSAVLESKSGSTAEVNVDLTQYMAKLGFSWNRAKNRFESLKISDWKYIAFQAIRSVEGSVMISSGAGEALPVASAGDYYVPSSLYVP